MNRAVDNLYMILFVEINKLNIKVKITKFFIFNAIICEKTARAASQSASCWLWKHNLDLSNEMKWNFCDQPAKVKVASASETWLLKCLWAVFKKTTSTKKQNNINNEATKAAAAATTHITCTAQAALQAIFT